MLLSSPSSFNKHPRIILIVMIDVPELVIHAGPVDISAHVLFESLAYTLGLPSTDSRGCTAAT